MSSIWTMLGHSFRLIVPVQNTQILAVIKRSMSQILDVKVDSSQRRSNSPHMVAICCWWSLSWKNGVNCYSVRERGKRDKIKDKTVYGKRHFKKDRHKLHQQFSTASRKTQCRINNIYKYKFVVLSQWRWARKQHSLLLYCHNGM